MVVSVITRTFKRTIFLKRSVELLKRASTTTALEWIIVNDCIHSDKKLEAFVEKVKSHVSFEVKIVESNQENRSAAANIGVGAATKEYIHILDDDDTISPDFYNETVKFLSNNPQYGGVCTLAEGVVERINKNGDIVELVRQPHYPEFQHVSFANLSVTQLFPPCAFIGRRRCFEDVGELDETLEVGEDYDYFLRFLCKYDIGVIPKTLCAFHRREEGAKIPSEWRNAPNAYEHLKYESLIRNKYFRQDLATGKLGLGWLLVLGEMTGSMRRLDILLSTLRKVPLMQFISKKWRK